MASLKELAELSESSPDEIEKRNAFFKAASEKYKVDFRKIYEFHSLVDWIGYIKIGWSRYFTLEELDIYARTHCVECDLHYLGAAQFIKIAIEREQGQKLCEFYKYPLP